MKKAATKFSLAIATLWFCVVVVQAILTLDKQGLAGMASSSALLVGLIFLPFVKLFHATTGDLENHKAAFEDLRGRLDPIYEERIIEIRKRDPLADALTLQSRGIFTVLPSVPGIRFYPGLMDGDYDMKALLSNLEASRSDPLVAHLDQLMTRDPREKAWSTPGVVYSSNVYREFIQVGGSYKERFNREMYQAMLAKVNQQSVSSPSNVRSSP